MKKALILFAMLAYSVNTFAVDLTPLSLYVSKIKESKKLVLNLDNMSATTVVCKISDQNGAIVFSERINTIEQKSRKYDLTSLTSGEYTISIDDLLKVEELDLSVSDNDIVVTQNKSEITYKPIVWAKKNRTIDFNLLALGKATSVKITNSAGDELYNEKFTGKTTIAKIYDFKKSPIASYTMEVSINGKTFYKYLTL